MPGDANGKALLFPASLNEAFVVAFEVLVSVLEVTKLLSVRLQGAPQDIHNVSESVRDRITTLQGMRTDKYFKKTLKMLSNSMVQPSRCQESTFAKETVKTIQLIALKSITNGQCAFHTWTFVQSNYARGSLRTMRLFVV